MPISEAHRRGNNAYKAKCDRIEFMPLKPVAQTSAPLPLQQGSLCRPTSRKPSASA